MLGRRLGCEEPLASCVDRQLGPGQRRGHRREKARHALGPVVEQIDQLAGHGDRVAAREIEPCRHFRDRIIQPVEPFPQPAGHLNRGGDLLVRDGPGHLEMRAAHIPAGDGCVSHGGH